MCELDRPLIIVVLQAHTLRLLILALHFIPIRKPPHSCALGLVVVKGALIAAPVRQRPGPVHQRALIPLADYLLPCGLNDVSAFSMLHSIRPPAAVDIPVLVGEDAFAVLAACLPVSVVASVFAGRASFLFGRASERHLADPAFDVLLPIALVYVPRGVGIGALAHSDLWWS